MSNGRHWVGARDERGGILIHTQRGSLFDKNQEQQQITPVQPSLFPSNEMRPLQEVDKPWNQGPGTNMLVPAPLR